MSKKRITQDYTRIETTKGITFEELTQKYNQKLEELHKKYDNVHDVKVTGSSHEYNDGEDWVEELEIRFRRNETDVEYKRRIEWQEYRKKEIEAGEIAKLRELMKKYPGLYSSLAKELLDSENTK
jgi:hypothetical protein